MKPTPAIPNCTIPCNLCGGVTIEILASRDRVGQPLQTVICRGCGLAWTDPRPTADANRQFYAEEYRQQYKATPQPKLKHVYRDMRRAMQRFGRIMPLLQPGMRVLDIGAGAGFFPYVVRRRGYAVTGLEPHAGYAAYAREEFGLDIRTGFIQEAEYAPASYDVVTLNHVLEHLEDPGLALTRIRDWLKPSGYLNLEVPNIEATYHAPGHKFHRAHLYSFNPDNLRRLCEKSGFVVQDLSIVPGTRHTNLILQRPESASLGGNRDWTIAGNHARIMTIFTAHTPWTHYLSPRPYLRFLHKLLGYAREQWVVRRFRRGRELADALLNLNRG